MTIFGTIIDYLKRFNIGYIQYGAIDSVNEIDATYIVKIGTNDTLYNVYDMSMHMGTGDKTTGGNSNDKYEPSGNICLLSKGTRVAIMGLPQGQKFIIGTGIPKDRYERWRKQSKLNMNRLPIKSTIKRPNLTTDEDNKTTDEHLKWGEYLIRSCGRGKQGVDENLTPADMFLDYIGNIVFDTSRQYTIRIGDRKTTGATADLNKITDPDLTVSFGNIVDSSGIQKKSGTKDVKVEILMGTDKKIQILSDGQVDINDGNLTIDK